jgi:hypothetical protein
MKYASVICVMSYVTGATGGAGIAYSSGTTWVIPVFSGPHVDQPLLIQHNTFVFGGFKMV